MMFWNLAFLPRAVLGAALHWLLIRSGRWGLAQVLVLCWQGGKLICRSLAACPALLGGNPAAMWQMQTQLESRDGGGDAANEVYQPGVVPRWRLLGTAQTTRPFSKCFSATEGLLAIQDLNLQNGFSAASKNAGCNISLLFWAPQKIEFCMCLLFQRQFSDAGWIHSCPIA